MTVDEVVDVGMVAHILLGIEHQMLFVLTQIDRLVALLMSLIAMTGPIQSEPHAPAGMHAIEQPLAGGVMEHTAQELEFHVGVTQSVAMGQIEYLIVNLDGGWLTVQNNATFLLQIAIGPQVVVACEEMYLDPHIGQFGDLTQETGESLGHHIAVLIPEVEHIAQQIDGCRLMLDTVEKPDESSFLHTSVLDGERSQVSIGEKINTFHIPMKLKPPKARFNLLNSRDEELAKFLCVLLNRHVFFFIDKSSNIQVFYPITGFVGLLEGDIKFVDVI